MKRNQKYFRKCVPDNEAWKMYRNSRDDESFGICSHNTSGFTVPCLNEDGLTALTPKMEYHVINL